MARFLIGIDLGTTNSALAYLDLKSHRPGGPVQIRPFPVPQLVAPGEVKERPLLPSFLYLPGPHDLPPGATALPWDPQRAFAVGEFARNHGSKVPGRLVSSAKSWLCHGGVDRSAGLLPWSAPPDVPRLSPVEASARYLRHLVESWNAVMAGSDPDARLEKQDVVLTVPASFDDVARNLTVEAARHAGLQNIVLLEEPQAAFYCWLVSAPPPELAGLRPGSRCLVVDVGGGTSDFSLIEAVEQHGDIGFVRSGGRGTSFAGRRQHGPGPGQVRRDPPARRPARRRRLRSAHPGVPAGQGSFARPQSAGQPAGHRGRPRPGGHRRHSQHPADRRHGPASAV